MGFKQLGNHKAHNESHSCDLPPSCFLPYMGICFWPVVMAWVTFPAYVLNRVRLFVTPWTVAHQATLSLGFSRQEYWSGLPFPSPGDLSNPGFKPASPVPSRWFFTTGPQSGAQWWIRVRSWALGQQGGHPEGPSHLIALGRLILLLPQTDPWEVSREVDSWLMGTVLWRSGFSGLSTETLPWPQTTQPRRMSWHLTEYGKPVWGKEMWKYFLSLRSLLTLNPLSCIYSQPPYWW